MKNFYEILEVDKNASQEIIEKAYKILVKKYHPDLQQSQTDKKFAEEQIKLINEAYDTLSDKNKKENYDINLKNKNITEDEYNLLINENLRLKKELNILKNKYNINYENNNTTNTNTNRNYYQNNNINNNINNNKNNYYTNRNNATNYNNKNYTNNSSNTGNSNNIFDKNYILFYLKNILISLLKLVLIIAFIFLAIYLLFQLPFFKNIINGNNLLFLVALIIGFIYFYSNR